MREVGFDVGAANTWVEFGVEHPDSYETWVGIFGRGIYGPKCAHLFIDDTHAFILSHGQGYVIDVRQQKLVHKTRNDYFQQVIPVQGLNAMVACDFGCVSFIELHAERWTTELIARDGIELLEASAAGIIGSAEQHNGWEDFKLDVETGSWIKD